jgi:hypothetical protein
LARWACAIALGCVSILACARPRDMEQRTMACTVRGKIREIGTVDISKTASAKNLYTELLLDVADVQPPERRAAVTRDVVFFKQGELPLKAGDTVELEVDTLDWSKVTRLRILRWRTLPQ